MKTRYLCFGAVILACAMPVFGQPVEPKAGSRRLGRSRRNPAAVHRGSRRGGAHCSSMTRTFEALPLVWGLSKPCGAQERVEIHRLDTRDYRIQMTVRFFPPYDGKQLVFRSSANPERSICYSDNGESSACLERFVGSLAIVTYRFEPRRKQVPQASTFREVVTVLGQSDGLDLRPPYTREESLFQGVGGDVQAFGYDESPVSETERSALRTKSYFRLWRRFRQELFVNGDLEPFGVLEWKHTLDRIELVRWTGFHPSPPAGRSNAASTVGGKRSTRIFWPLPATSFARTGGGRRRMSGEATD